MVETRSSTRRDLDRSRREPSADGNRHASRTDQDRSADRLRAPGAESLGRSVGLSRCRPDHLRRRDRERPAGSAGRARDPRGRGPAAGHGESGDRRVRGARRRGMPRGVRAHDLGERGAAARRDRRTVPHPRHQLVRRRRVARGVDVLALQRLAHRRALRDRQPDRPAGSPARRGELRAVAHRPEVPRLVSRRVSGRGHHDRRRSGHRAERGGRHRCRQRAPRRRARTPSCTSDSGSAWSA